ncbi:MAG: AbgT family transporter [Synergistaceae bacterium]|jgi:uncharacterized ion transporter superfamily protein YfcC|nr:AbgT family transporter [Synergistaceae bacterium]
MATNTTEAPRKKALVMINSFALLFFVIIFAAVLTHVIPAGEFTRMEVNGRTVVDPTSFKRILPTPASFFDVFRAVPYGLSAAAMMVLSSLLIGGGIAVVQETGALNIGIAKMIKKVGTQGGDWILAILFMVFALMGAFLGFIEGSIPFIPLAISIAVGLGYDSIVGVGVAMLGALAGFSGGPTNPFSVGVAHAVAELPMFSGAGLRICLTVVLCLVTLHHILRYGKKTKLNPAKSYMTDIDTSDLKFDAGAFEKSDFRTPHVLILAFFLSCLVLFVYGALNWRWSFGELGALYLLVGVFSGILGCFGINKTAEIFVSGASKMAAGGMIIGVARGIQWMLDSGHIIDTIIYYLSAPLANLPAIAAPLAIFLIVGLINFLIPSGSAKAMAMMPIIIPMGDIIGTTRQTAILAYQLGDGVFNIICPTLGVLLFALAFGKVPFDRWVKFTLPLVMKLVVVGVIFLVIAVQIHYGPF